MSQINCEKHSKPKSYSCSTCDSDEALCIECYGEKHVGHILGKFTLKTIEVLSCCPKKLVKSVQQECAISKEVSCTDMHNLMKYSAEQTTVENNDYTKSRTSPLSQSSSTLTLIVDEDWLIQYKYLRKYLAVHKGNSGTIFDTPLTANPRLSALQTWLREQIERRKQGRLVADKEAALQRFVDTGELSWDAVESASERKKSESSDRSDEPRHTAANSTAHINAGALSLSAKSQQSVRSLPERTTNDTAPSVDIILSAQSRSTSKSAPSEPTQSIPLLRRKRPKLRGEEEWMRNYCLLLTRRDAHGTYDMPESTVVATDDGEAVELGKWLAHQRRLLPIMNQERQDALVQLAETGLLWTSEEGAAARGAETTATGSGTSTTEIDTIIMAAPENEIISQQVSSLPRSLPMGKHVVPCRKRPKPTTSTAAAVAVIPQTLVVSSEDEDEGDNCRSRWFAPSESLGSPSQVSTGSCRVERSSDGDYFSDQSTIEHLLLQQQRPSGASIKKQRGRKRKLNVNSTAETMTSNTAAINKDRQLLACDTFKCGADLNELQFQTNRLQLQKQNCSAKRMRSISSTSGGGAVGGGGIVLASPFQLEESAFTFTADREGDRNGSSPPSDVQKSADKAQKGRSMPQYAVKHSAQRVRRAGKVTPLRTGTVVAYAYTTDRRPRTNRLGIGKVVDQRAVRNTDGSTVTKWDIWQYRPWDAAVGAEKYVCGIDDFLTSQFKSAPTAHVVALDHILLRDLKVTNGGKLSKSSAQTVRKLYAEHSMILTV